MDIHCDCYPLAVEGHTASWQEAGSEKKSGFLERSEPCHRAVWVAVLKPLSQPTMAAPLRLAFSEKTAGAGPAEDPAWLSGLFQVLPSQGHPCLVRQGPQKAALLAQRASIRRHSPCLYPFRDRRPRGGQKGTAGEEGLTFRAQQKTRDKGWCTLSLFKILLKKENAEKKHQLHQGQDATQACRAALREGN